MDVYIVGRTCVLLHMSSVLTQLFIGPEPDISQALYHPLLVSNTDVITTDINSICCFQNYNFAKP